ncbi:acetyltransferase GNAT [Listeria weihenstephanensis FSL R9-0317]|nr:immunity protein YezG family protein [Listeria weihenstephanensis]EUJ41248.1 acetyltransferase GNAT [Listeria weihenstephanensis FSL R9-0317]
MFEKELNKIYVEIAQQTSDMIPCDWNSFYLNGDVYDS